MKKIESTVNSEPSPSFERISDVSRRVGLSQTTIRRWVAEGIFPPPATLGPNIVAWVTNEVNDWIEQRIQARDLSLRSRGSHDE